MSKNQNYENTSTENSKKKFPTAIYFILGNEFCERFTFYGLQALLSLYLINELHYSETMSITIFHIWKSLSYFFPVFGAIIADSKFGKFRTILYLSLLYTFGNVLISIGSIPQKLDTMRALSLTGLIIVSIGTGGIKPCVSAFGGDQYDTNQLEDRRYFFSMFYFLINAGSLLSMLISPLLRAALKCLGSDSCYPLAFALPAILMFTAIIVFIAGKNLYRTRKPEKNALLLFFACIFHALAQKMKAKKRDKEHWLDYAEGKYDEEFIQDAKLVLRVWLLMIPLPFFWTLFDQMGSRWTFQATKLDRKIGSLEILPEQMQIVNPIFILTLIPFFDYILYPCFRKINLLNMPLQRIITGGMLASLAFVAAGFLEIGVENYISASSTREISEENIKKNSICISDFVVSNNEYQNEFLTRKKNYSQFEEYPFKVIAIQEDGNHSLLKLMSLQYHAKSKLSSFTTNKLEIKAANNLKSIVENEHGVWSFILPQYNKSSSRNSHKSTSNYSNEFILYLKLNHFKTRECKDFHVNFIRIYMPKKSNIPNGIIAFKAMEDNRIFLQYQTNSSYELHAPRDEENKTPISVLYQIPQYFILTCGEIMFSVSGLDFSYSQAPLSMKSVMQASWLLTTAFGNLITIIVANSRLFEKQSWEFFTFAALMASDITIFGIMAYFYKYRTVTEKQNVSEKFEE